MRLLTARMPAIVLELLAAAMLISAVFGYAQMKADTINCSTASCKNDSDCGNTNFCECGGFDRCTFK